MDQKLAVYHESPLSVIEAWILGYQLCSTMYNCDVFVNPSNKFLRKKVLILYSEPTEYQVRFNQCIIRPPYGSAIYKGTSELRIRAPIEVSSITLSLSNLNKFEPILKDNTLILKYRPNNIDLPLGLSDIFKEKLIIF